MLPDGSIPHCSDGFSLSTNYVLVDQLFPNKFRYLFIALFIWMSIILKKVTRFIL